MIADLARQWPAYSLWTFEWFRKNHGGLIVPVEFSQVDPARESIRFEKNEVPLREYIDTILSDTPGEKGYLAELRVRRSMPSLMADIAFPKCHKWSYAFVNLWIGPQGKESQLHFDYLDNFLAQVVGRKRVKLYSPESAVSRYPTMSPFSHFSMMEHLHRAAAGSGWQRPREEVAPDYDVVVGAGDMLFIPARWWHKVISLDPTVSANQFYVPVTRIPMRLVSVGAYMGSQRLKRWKRFRSKSRAGLGKPTI
ncbi:MAG: cupin-like domain-containing protein [Gemmatimonadetes bacterium]|nr:cupin-like domain-containing protein [Gemmatimonadota bacterium]